jgi:hypothetical protein
MARSAVSARKPSAATAGEGAAPKPPKVLDDKALKTVTTAIRRDLWRDLNKLAIDREATIQAVMNRAVYDYLVSQNYTPGAPLEEDD